MQDKTLFISAGHSYRDPGASGNGYTEADLVLGFRDKVADFLDEMGIVFGRDGKAGENLNLSTASKMARKHDVSIEFHFNSFSDPAATGVEVLCGDLYPHKDLARQLCNSASSILGIANRGVKPEDSGQHSRLAFIRAGGMIHEIAFISNPDDVASFIEKEDELAEEAAELLADAVARLY